jgi:hypothetical protein
MVTTKEKLEEITKEINEIEIPQFISRNLIMEVTDRMQFTNKYLSIIL